MNTRLFTFIGGNVGTWRILNMQTISGEPLPSAERLDITLGPPSAQSHEAKWSLRGITSNDRYLLRDEKELLVAKQPGLGRAEATCGALIPIRKTAAWWSLTQDERREVIETQSNHIKLGLQYLPAIARRLHHCRDLGENEPFDFLTWFEYAPADEKVFNNLVAELRASPEWAYVEREIDCRVMFEPVA